MSSENRPMISFWNEFGFDPWVKILLRRELIIGLFRKSAALSQTLSHVGLQKGHLARIDNFEFFGKNSKSISQKRKMKP